MTNSRRRVAIFLWAALIPFVTVACIFSLVLWTHPEWHSSTLVAPIGFGTAIIVGGAALFRMQLRLLWRIVAFVAYAVAALVPLFYFAVLFLCFCWGICGL